MGSNRYPPTADALRGRLQTLSLEPLDSDVWPRFMSDVIRMPMWMLPAVHAAIQEKTWIAAHDPLEKIRGQVRRFAIAMKLNNSEKRVAIDPDDAVERPVDEDQADGKF